MVSRDALPLRILHLYRGWENQSDNGSVIVLSAASVVLFAVYDGEQKKDEDNLNIMICVDFVPQINVPYSGFINGGVREGETVMIRGLPDHKCDR